LRDELAVTHAALTLFAVGIIAALHRPDR